MSADFFAFEPYVLNRKEKGSLFLERMNELSSFHEEHCEPYQKMIRAAGFSVQARDLSEVPFLPVRMFKERKLLSVPEEAVIKTMTSSGTSGQQVSKIYLDKDTSVAQQKALAKIVSAYTGAERMPMIIIDMPSVVRDRALFSARGAGILGFSIFGRDRFYALRDNMSLDTEGLAAYLDKHKKERILLFGFTFMIWQYFYKELMKMKEKGVTIDLSQGILIHGGGWKKLLSERVSAEEFATRLKEVCGLDSVHDYYGMVEQTGSIYMQCRCGHLHASVFSDVLFRRPKDFSCAERGERGIIETFSVLPTSYPGHALLTEDIGVFLGEDDCLCGRKGKYFTVEGRLQSAEVRGCSDTYEMKDSA